MDWTPVFDFLMGLAPWVQYALMALGSITVVGTAVDAAIPDEKDHGFMKKVMAIPVLGSFLQAVAKFSPFNSKE